MFNRHNMNKCLIILRATISHRHYFDSFFHTSSAWTISNICDKCRVLIVRQCCFQSGILISLYCDRSPCKIYRGIYRRQMKLFCLLIQFAIAQISFEEIKVSHTSYFLKSVNNLIFKKMTRRSYWDDFVEYTCVCTEKVVLRINFSRSNYHDVFKKNMERQPNIRRNGFH